jgi:hypothetical protein
MPLTVCVVGFFLILMIFKVVNNSKVKLPFNTFWKLYFIYFRCVAEEKLLTIHYSELDMRLGGRRA